MCSYSFLRWSCLSHSVIFVTFNQLKFYNWFWPLVSSLDLNKELNESPPCFHFFVPHPAGSSNSSHTAGSAWPHRYTRQSCSLHLLPQLTWALESHLEACWKHPLSLSSPYRFTLTFPFLAPIYSHEGTVICQWASVWTKSDWLGL